MASSNQKTFTITEEQNGYVIQALELKRQSLQRYKNQQVAGSAMFNAVNVELQVVNDLIRSFSA